METKDDKDKKAVEKFEIDKQKVIEKLKEADGPIFCCYMKGGRVRGSLLAVTGLEDLLTFSKELDEYYSSCLSEIVRSISRYVLHGESESPNGESVKDGNEKDKEVCRSRN